jgi:hypothetical protein
VWRGGDDETLDVAAVSPRKLAEAANLDGVHSGELEVALRIGNQGKGEAVNMRLLGVFMRSGRGICRNSTWRLN